MTKRQAEIPGFERQVQNQAVEDACVKWYGVMAERAALSKKESLAKLESQATMRAHGLTEYEFWDPEAEVYRTARLESKETIVIDKAVGHDDGPGEGVDEDKDETNDLVAQARKAQSDAGVAEDGDGDVVVPETSVPKSKKRGAKKKAH